MNSCNVSGVDEGGIDEYDDDDDNDGGDDEGDDGVRSANMKRRP